MLELGANGTEVGALQQSLVEAGYSIASGELSGNIFGESMQAAVEQFQHNHVDANGHALAVDGKVGPATLWALGSPTGGGAGYTVPGWRCEPSACCDPGAIREPVSTVLRAAMAEIGVHEDPPRSNTSPRIVIYTGGARNDDGSYPPWCAFFVSWVWARADGGSPFGVLASAYKLSEWGKAHGKIVTAPKAGDIFVKMRDKFHGHVGLVACVLDPSRIATIEGNSSDSVRGLIRPVADITCFVRPA